jgi:Sulfotransferase domain
MWARYPLCYLLSFLVVAAGTPTFMEHLLTANSTCIDAFIRGTNAINENSNERRGRYRPDAQQRGNYDDTKDQQIDHPSGATLKVVNCGAGTTGTTTVHNVLCDMGLHAIHYLSECNRNISSNTPPTPGREVDVNPLIDFHNSLLCCISLESARNNSHCGITTLLRQLDASIRVSISVYEAISDTPVHYILPILTKLIPDLQIIITVRDPGQWSRSRSHKHGHSTIICRPEIMKQQRAVRHIFDIIPCLQSAESTKLVAHEVLMTLSQYERQYRPERYVDEIAKGYMEMNR